LEEQWKQPAGFTQPQLGFIVAQFCYASEKWCFTAIGFTQWFACKLGAASSFSRCRSQTVSLA
jgi:hypothetical protein